MDQNNQTIKIRKLIKSFSLYNKKPKEKIINFKKFDIKKQLSFRKTLNNRFYKTLKNTIRYKPKNTLFPRIIDKNTFDFSLKDENSDILRRINNINKGNIKHLQYSILSNKKKIAKIKEAKEFREKMKVIQRNLEIIKKNSLEEKKKMKELMLIRKTKKHKKKSDKKDIKKIGPTNAYERKLNIKKFGSFDDYERKLNLKNAQIMNKYKEIMNKIRKKDSNCDSLKNF